MEGDWQRISSYAYTIRQTITTQAFAHACHNQNTPPILIKNISSAMSSQAHDHRPGEWGVVKLQTVIIHHLIMFQACCSVALQFEE